MKIALANGTSGIVFISVWMGMVGATCGTALGAVGAGVVSGIWKVDPPEERLFLAGAVSGALLFGLGFGCRTLMLLFEIRKENRKTDLISRPDGSNRAEDV